MYRRFPAFALSNAGIISNWCRCRRSAPCMRATNAASKIVAYQNGEFIQNKNPGCLLSIEVESSKLIMGDFTNARMMEHVALVIGPSEGDVMKRIIFVQRYIQTLRHLGKADPTLFMNVACLDANAFWQILKRFTDQTQ